MAIATLQMVAIASTGTYPEPTPAAATDAQRAILAVSYGLLLTAAPSFDLRGFSKYGHGFQMN
jgi:hypothetical protein